MLSTVAVAIQAGLFAAIIGVSAATSFKITAVVGLAVFVTGFAWLGYDFGDLIRRVNFLVSATDRFNESVKQETNAIKLQIEHRRECLHRAEQFIRMHPDLLALCQLRLSEDSGLMALINFKYDYPTSSDDPIELRTKFAFELIRLDSLWGVCIRLFNRYPDIMACFLSHLNPVGPEMRASRLIGNDRYTSNLPL